MKFELCNGKYERSANIRLTLSRSLSQRCCVPPTTFSKLFRATDIRATCSRVCVGIPLGFGRRERVRAYVSVSTFVLCVLLGKRVESNNKRSSSKAIRGLHVRRYSSVKIKKVACTRDDCCFTFTSYSTNNTTLPPPISTHNSPTCALFSVLHPAIVCKQQQQRQQQQQQNSRTATSTSSTPALTTQLRERNTTCNLFPLSLSDSLFTTPPSFRHSGTAQSASSSSSNSSPALFVAALLSADIYLNSVLCIVRAFATVCVRVCACVLYILHIHILTPTCERSLCRNFVIV